MIDRLLIKGLEDIDPDITMRAALNDCNMEYVLYAQRLGGKARDTKTPALNCSDPTLHQWIIDNVSPEVYQHSVATIIENRPELVPLYMNTLPAKLYYKALDEMVEAAIKSPDEAVYREVLANPIVVGELNKKWSHLNYDTSQLSAERFNYLLGQLSRSAGLRLLAHLPFDQLASIPTHSYTSDELAEILIGHRVGLDGEDWPYVRAFALTIPPAQRDAVLSALNAHQAWDPSVYREYVDVIARVFDGQL